MGVACLSLFKRGGEENSEKKILPSFKGLFTKAILQWSRHISIRIKYIGHLNIKMFIQN